MKRGRMEYENDHDASPTIASTSVGANSVEVTSAAKNKRYDRQLRIWGVEGQQRLESCKLCLLNCGPTGAETLKNLVLGGIAGFTIVDGHKVQAADLGNNFMLTADTLGEPRAKVVTQLIKELNDLVAGSYVEEHPEQMIQNNKQFFAQFNVVIATQLREPDLLELEQICMAQRVMLLVVRSYGLAGVVRPSIAEHTIIESKPDNLLYDLRLYEPFKALQQYADSIDLSTLDEATLHHVPYVVLLIKAAQAWRASHGDKAPATSKERSEFKELLNSLDKHAQGGVSSALNFEEAAKAAFYTWSDYSIDKGVQAILQDECAQDSSIGPGTSDFWLLVAALRRFVAKEGGGKYLPLDGSIPDMHAMTDLYLRTQRLYREKAEDDVKAFKDHLTDLLALRKREGACITDDKVRLFCKNARNLSVVRFRSIQQEFNSGARGDALAAALSSDVACAAFYVLMRAADKFYAQCGRFPGSQLSSSLEEDVPALRQCTQQVLTEMGAPSASIPDDYILEMIRFGAAELHVVASIMGGIAAQEAIKLVTGQFTCIPGTLVFNGVGATTSVLEL